MGGFRNYIALLGFVQFLYSVRDIVVFVFKNVGLRADGSQEATVKYCHVKNAKVSLYEDRCRGELGMLEKIDRWLL